jgi:arylsulfatase A-like enzyme
MVGSNYPHVPWPTETDGIASGSLVLPAGSVDTTTTRIFRAQYTAAVRIADDDLGRIYDAAQEKLSSSTIFLMSSDHGAQWPFAKWTCYDAGLKVPLMIQWPGVLKPKTRTDAMVSWVDILPTLIEAAGGKAPASIDGRSFLPVLLGKSAGHRDRIFATHTGDGRWNVYPMRALRTAQWKYILNLHPEFAFTSHLDLPGELTQHEMWLTWLSAAKQDPKADEIVKHYRQRPSEELYDLAHDPDELHNLAQDTDKQERLSRMRQQVRQWMRDQDDQSTVPAKPRLLSDKSSYVGP